MCLKCIFSFFSDYCDYFLFSNNSISNLPLECICQWKILKFTKEGVDFSRVTDEICKQFKKDNNDIILHRRPACIGRPCTSTDFTSIPFEIDLNNTLLYKDIDNIINNGGIINSFSSQSSLNTVVDAPASPPVFDSPHSVPRISNGPKILGMLKLFAIFRSN